MFDRFSKIDSVLFWFFGTIVAVATNFISWVFIFLFVIYVKIIKIVVLNSLGKKNKQTKTLKQEHPQRLKFFECDTQTKTFSVFTFWVIKHSLTGAEAKESKYYLWTKPTQCVPLFGCK